MTARPARAPRKLTLAEHIEVQIDRLYLMLPMARNERRAHAATEQLLDDLDAAGRALRRIGRGRS